MLSQTQGKVSQYIGYYSKLLEQSIFPYNKNSDKKMITEEWYFYYYT